MTLFENNTPLPPVPDNLTIPQFMLRENPALRPVRPRNVPYFIEDRTGRGYTFQDVHHRTYGFANALSIKWKISRGDVVCIFSPNHVDYANCVWAIHTLGGVVTPANPAYTADELVHQLLTSKASLIITHPACLATTRAAARTCKVPENNIILLDPEATEKQMPTFEELVQFGASKPENYQPIRLKPGEAKTMLAFLSFSSGTTGKPKAVAIPHYGIIVNLYQMTVHYRLNDPSWPDKRFVPGDVALGVLPFYHIYGLVVIMHFSLFCGMTVVCVPKFNFEEFLNSITRYRVTHLFIVPPQIVLLCKHPLAKNRNFNHVKFVMSGAAPLNGDLMQQVSTVFPNSVIGQGFGMTETCATVSHIRPDQKFGTIGGCGELLPGWSAKIVKADGTLGKEGEQGELVLKGPSNALGYYGNPKATAETFVDGWVHSGDEVIIRNNEIFIIDRLKEIMKVKGFQVAPAELEGHLLLHPDVKDACVVPVPDEYSGEVPMAFVVPSDRALKEIQKGEAAALRLKKQLQKHVSDAKVPYKWLAGGVDFIDAIPKNPSGKILRRNLRDHARATRKPKLLEAKL